jgi:hypothetical protein
MVASTLGSSKQLSSKPLDMLKAGGSSNLSGPTTSKRDYPKGNAPSDTRAAPFNPQNVGTTGIYVEGV